VVFVVYLAGFKKNYLKMNGGTSRRGKRSKGQSSGEMPVIQVGTDGASRHAALHQFGGLDQYALNNSTPIAASSIAFATPGTIGNTQQENAQNVPNLSDTVGEIQELLQKMHANIQNMDAKLEETWKRILASETRLELMMERKMDMLLANTSCLHEGLASLTGQLEVSAHQNAQANIMNRQVIGF
jgi:Skp family chaperone for outer membrane proteins